MKTALNHLKHNLVAYVALFVALGGTSYAAVSLPAGSVGTKQLRNGSVTGSKLARGAVSPANLNSKTIAAHIALWAQIRAGGQLVGSRPAASVFPSATPGIERISWKKSISSHCVALADAYNNSPGTAAGSATLLGPLRLKHSTGYLITAFDGGGIITPQNVNVIVVCP